MPNYAITGNFLREHAPNGFVPAVEDTFPRGIATQHAERAFVAAMQPACRHTDWSVLSGLLRLAQREGWRVEFTDDHILLSSRRAAEGVIVLPAALMRHARASGWQTSRLPQGFMLRHPAVRQSVSLQLEG